jgi:hypothetical protein
MDMDVKLLLLLLSGRVRPARVVLVYHRPRASNLIPSMHYTNVYR